MGTALLFFSAYRTMHRSTKLRAVMTAAALRGAASPSGGRKGGCGGVGVSGDRSLGQVRPDRLEGVLVHTTVRRQFYILK